MADIDGGLLAERHAQSLQAFIFLFDIGGVDAEVGVALVVGLQRLVGAGRRGAVLEHLQVAGAGAQHGAAGSRVRHVHDVVDERIIAPAERLAHDLETKGLAVELDHAVEVANVNRNVVYAPYHRFVLQSCDKIKG